MTVSMDLTDGVVDFAIALASAARLFTLAQVAQHPDLCGRSRPQKSASEVLARRPELFERIPGPVGQPHRWRLSKKTKQKLGLTYHNVDAQSQRVDHWLGLGDVWCQLTFNGGRPEVWVSEPDHVFDIYCKWKGNAYLIEYQRSPLSENAWTKKWAKRIEWFKAQKWEQRPRVVLINLTGQQDKTICLPPGTLHVKRVEELHHVLNGPPR